MIAAAFTAASLVLYAAGRVPSRPHRSLSVPPLDPADVEFVTYIPRTDLPPTPPTRSEREALWVDPTSWPREFVDAECARLERQLGEVA